MASVDDRIVRMEFDNAAFEKKISTTLASLGQLDKALKLTGATKGLTDVGDAANKVSFHTISDGIENVSKSFIALSTIAITTLSNITNRAVTAGLQFLKSFTFGPIFDGFREFETNANSIQTILANTASKGTTLAQVNDALNLLNIYSDKTIFNFAEMARNIGTFTAAGVDLNTSVDAIKGIANLAAMSGSSSEQAATAMYQLSQAISAGSLKLMDWNSVVNAGMGGEAFKSALFETAKAMGNVLDVPVDQTFNQWEDAGHSFRESLQDGWITADILTTTLSTFTGDMTEEMLLAKGFNEQQAQAILKTAAIATAAATEVKTFTQLVGTVKEAIGTGFADSFRIVIGNFNEAKALFTDINNAIGGFVGRTADARNAILQGWKDFGGRTQIIETFKTAFSSLGDVLAVVKTAFINIFPPITAATLIRLTQSFHDLVQSLIPTQNTLNNIRTIFLGFFSALSIGWEILKEGVKFLVNLGRALLGIIAPDAVNFVVKLSDGIIKLQDSLVEGGKIKAFFDTLTAAIQKPIAFLKKLRDAVAEVFGFFTGDVATAGIDRLGNRFENLKGIFSAAGKLWEPFENALRKIVDVLDQIWIVIRDWFKELGRKMADALGEGDFSAVLDAINTGLLGGIALLLAKFIKSGFSFDIGGGFLEKLGNSFEQLTGVLSAMQAKLKADALVRIATAIAILTVSLVALSLIDPEKLSTALAAMAVGFGELMASFTVLTKIVTGPMGAINFTTLSAGLILLSVAILILSAAVKVMSSMDWEELTKGLLGVAGVLGTLVLAVKPLSANSEGMIAAGTGIAAIGVGLLIISGAMKVLATMSWEEMAKGLVGIAGGLGSIIAAMKLMPNDAKLISTGIGIASISAGLLVLSGAVAIFGNMDWKTIAKGFVGIGGGLALIVAAMNLMPLESVQASAFVLISTGLLGLATTMKIIAGMDIGEIAKSLGVLAIALGGLIAAMFAMEGASPGAFALVVIVGALGGLAIVLKTYAALKIMDIVKGLVAIAAVLGLIAGASILLSESIPFILLFGVALALVGAGVALAGAGVFLLAKGFQILASSSVNLAKSLPAVLEALAKSLPSLIKGLAEGLVELALVFVKAAPIFAKLIGVLIEHIVDTLITLFPKLELLFNMMIDSLIRFIREKGQPLIAAGLFILIQFLKGIRDNIGHIVHVVADIISNVLTALQAEIPRLAQGIADTIITAFESAANAIGQIAFTIMYGVALEFVKGFFQGLEDALGPVGAWLADLGNKVVTFIGDVARTLWNKGIDIIGGLFGGLTEKWSEVAGWIISLPGKIADAFPDPTGILYNIGTKIMEGFKNGLERVWNDIKDFIGSIAGWIGDHKGPPEKDAVLLYNNGLLIMRGLHRGMEKQWKETQGWIKKINPAESLNNNLGNNMAKALSTAASQISSMEDFNPTITPVLDLTQVASEAKKIGDHIGLNHKLNPSFSIDQARTIAHQQRIRHEDSVAAEPAATQGVNFTQINNSPTQLSTSDIYKQTRNQIRIAKEELSIP